MTRQEVVRAWCIQRVGCPYIYGGTGQPCTPEYRQARAQQYPDYAEKIRKNCPRLSGKASTCADCRWCDPETGIGKPAYDCAQLSRGAMAAVGISLVSGANSQWERTKWTECGTINNLPSDRVALVFRRDTDRMGHVGVYLGDGTVVHAKAHDAGVVRQKLAECAFTHWGLPEGMLSDAPIRPVLRRGDTGDMVVLLQTLLCSVVKPITVDGIFGSGTEAAVKEFQKSAGLTVDGVVGPKTWTALEKATGHNPDEPLPPAPEQPDTISISRADWQALRDMAGALAQILSKYESVG